MSRTRHCRTRQRHPQARDPQHRHRGLSCGGDVHVLVAGHNAGWRRAGRRADRRRGQGAARRRRRAWPWPGRERRRAGAGRRQELQPPAVPGHRQRQERGPARGRAAGRGADQRRHQGHQRRHLRAPDLRRQRHRHRAEHRRHQGHHRAHHRLRSRGRQRRQRRVESLAAVADSGLSSFLGAEIAKLDRPELTAAKIIVSGGRAMGSSPTSSTKC
jgi:hypothetical protein